MASAPEKDGGYTDHRRQVSPDQPLPGTPLHDLHIRLLCALKEEVHRASHDVERTVAQLVTQVKALASDATAQSGEVRKVLDASRTLPLNGHDLPVASIPDTVETHLATLLETPTQPPQAGNAHQDDQCRARTGLSDLVLAMASSHTALHASLARAGEISDSITDTVAATIQDVQFQDRTAQRLDNIAALLALMVEMHKEHAATDPVRLDETIWFEKVLARTSLAEMRQRLSTAIASDKTRQAPSAERLRQQDDAPDIELF